jgi:antirestriction protein ArdC
MSKKQHTKKYFSDELKDNPAAFNAGDDVIFFSDSIVKRTGYCPDLVAAHELIHWTGHKKRLNRVAFRFKNDKPITFKVFREEEIIATLGGLVLLEALGLVTDRTRLSFNDLVEHLDIVLEDGNSLQNRIEQAVVFALGGKKKWKSYQKLRAKNRRKKLSLHNKEKVSLSW